MNPGPLLSLGCAVFWALTVILFRKANSGIPARALNLLKNGIGLAFMVPTVYLMDGQLFVPTDPKDLVIIILSGVIGIGIADSLYLWTLEIIGASRLAIIDCVYAPTVVLLSWLFLGETLGPWLIVGGVLILIAVALVTIEKQAVDFNNAIIKKGSIYCGIAIAAMALGIVMVKPLFGRVELFWLIFLRLAAGFSVSLITVFLSKSPRSYFEAIRQGKNMKMVFVASFFGTYLSMLCWVAGFKYNTASLAAILNQTTTIFTVVLAHIFLAEPLTRRKCLATFAATLGVVIISILNQ